MCGSLCMPTGTVYLEINGKWENVALTDNPSKAEIMDLVEMWKGYGYKVTGAKYNNQIINIGE